MSQNEIAAKVAQIKELAQLIEEAESEVETLKDEIKAHMTAQNTDEINAGVFKVRYTTVKSNRFDNSRQRVGTFQCNDHGRYIRTSDRRSQGES